MKRRRLLLFGLIVIFFHILRLWSVIPYLVNGFWVQGLGLLPTDKNTLVIQVFDLLVAYLFALIPYEIIYRTYPKWIAPGLVLAVGILGLLFILYFRGTIILQRKDIRLRDFSQWYSFYLALYTLFGIAFFFARFTRYKELQSKELQLQHHRAELSFLRSQVNPHFLFNSLNNIYALVYQGSAQSLTAIAGLSDLLRYMLYDASEAVPLEKEMDYIKKYIELQKLRFEAALILNLRVTGDTAAVMVPPLLLIPFVENAFKHGNLTSGDGLSITLHSTPEKTWFHCHNQKGDYGKDDAGGIGLDNVTRRLNLLYPGRHEISITDHPDHFTVNLELIHG